MSPTPRHHAVDRYGRLAAATVAVLVPVTACSSGDGGAAADGASTSTSLTVDATSTTVAADPAPTPTSATTAATTELLVDLDEELAALEASYDARLGVYALDTGSGREIAYRADERFGHASTFKALLCGVVLQQRSAEELNEVIPFTSDDLVTWSPVTETRIETGMSIAELCQAAVTRSDNTATNLLLDEIGGPAALQDALRENGDDVISTDRYEVEMSDAVPGDTRDTSTPRSIATSLRTFVLGDALPEDQRELLTGWLVGNTTGTNLIRAGVPEGWVVGDKTGNGGYGTRNDIAVVWPPGGDPIVIAILSSRDEAEAEHDDQLIADAAAEVTNALSG